MGDFDHLGDPKYKWCNFEIVARTNLVVRVRFYPILVCKRASPSTYIPLHVRESIVIITYDLIYDCLHAQNELIAS